MPSTNPFRSSCESGPQLASLRQTGRTATLACGQEQAPGDSDMGDKGMDQANLLLDLQQMPDLSLEAGQSCLVNAVLGNQEFILKSQRQLCQVDISI